MCNYNKIIMVIKWKQTSLLNTYFYDLYILEYVLTFLSYWFSSKLIFDLKLNIKSITKKFEMLMIKNLKRNILHIILEDKWLCNNTNIFVPKQYTG